ncbi:MAG: 3-deoxy-D-manno-octulosonic acid transferase [Candidatus Omnitrophica bacterium]|nr:3-deoxy-D-manno-octulosonic acid transferase [Candidatus Omnitrophota bacterium]
MQRLGLLSNNQKLTTNNHAIWLHAVSVGEVATLRPLWERLRTEYPSKKIIISTVTRTGNELARKFSNSNEIVLYLPFDISFIVNSFLNRFKPRCLIIAETEIWPNLITACRARGIPVIIVNGRISNRAFKRYRLVKPLLKAILRKIDFIGAQTEGARGRFIFLGAPPENVKITGNLKYDIRDYTPARILKPDCTDLRKKLGIGGQGKIFVAGSTHKGEEEIVLDVFRKLAQDFKDLYLIIAPRHIERAAEVRRLAAGLSVRITVIDKIGALNDAYSISDIVFVGGSLVPKGGHNIIEPAFFAKPILFGPHMFNFEEIAGEFLKARAAIMVKGENELEANCRLLLTNDKERASLGGNARDIILKNRGAAENCVIEIKKVIGDA